MNDSRKFRLQLYRILETLVTQPPDINVEQALNICLARNERPIIVQLSNININIAIMNVVQTLKILDDAEQEKAKIAQMWNELGLTSSEIAEELSLGERQVYRLLKQVNDKCHEKT